MKIILFLLVTIIPLQCAIAAISYFTPDFRLRCILIALVFFPSTALIRRQVQKWKKIK